jgi:preprotein translocase SecE subunit
MAKDKSDKKSDKKQTQEETKLATADSATVVASSNASNNNSEGRRKKRQLRATPSTLREQSEQAIDRAGRPSNRRRSANVVGRVVAAPFRIIAWPFKQLSRVKPFRLLFKGIGYVLAPPYVRNAFRELRLVTWPNTTQSRQLTSAVIIFSLIFGTLAAITDYGLNALFRHVILKH